jgi:hypothetical protein
LFVPVQPFGFPQGNKTLPWPIDNLLTIW